jgi:penicillin amidase
VRAAPVATTARLPRDGRHRLGGAAPRTRGCIGCDAGASSHAADVVRGRARPARAAQIRDALTPLERATPKDLLAIQLDDRALFLTAWQKLLVETLTPTATAEKKSRAELRGLVENWAGRASLDSVSYRLVRDFREAVYQRIFPAIFDPCIDTGPAFNWRKLHLESALWTMLREKPAHLLNPAFPTWDAVLLAAAKVFLHITLTTATNKLDGVYGRLPSPYRKR